MEQNGKERRLLYSKLRNKILGFWVGLGFFVGVGLLFFFSLPEISIFLTVIYVKTSELYFKINFISILGLFDERNLKGLIHCYKAPKSKCRSDIAGVRSRCR